MTEQSVIFQTSCFRTVLIVFMVNTAQGATAMFAVDDHERLISQARRLLSAYDIYPSIRHFFADDVTCWIYHYLGLRFDLGNRFVLSQYNRPVVPPNRSPGLRVIEFHQIYNVHVFVSRRSFSCHEVLYCFRWLWQPG